MVQVGIEPLKQFVVFEMPLNCSCLFDTSLEGVADHGDGLGWMEKILPNSVGDSEENGFTMAAREQVQAERNVVNDLGSEIRMHRPIKPPIPQDVF